MNNFIFAFVGSLLLFPCSLNSQSIKKINSNENKLVTSFCSVDLSAFDLYGNVKSCTTTFLEIPEKVEPYEIKDEEELGFSTTGLLTTIGELLLNYDAAGKALRGSVKESEEMIALLERDSVGRIAFIKKCDGEGEMNDMSYTITFTYFPNGKIQTVENQYWETIESSEFSLDEQGRVLRCVETRNELEDGTTTKTTETYQYTKFDKKGNWMERKATVQAFIEDAFSKSSRTEELPSRIEKEKSPIINR